MAIMAQKESSHGQSMKSILEKLWQAELVTIKSMDPSTPEDSVVYSAGAPSRICDLRHDTWP